MGCSRLHWDAWDSHVVHGVLLGAVSCSTGVLWRLCYVSKHVECAVLHWNALMCLGCPKGCAVGRR